MSESIQRARTDRAAPVVARADLPARFAAGARPHGLAPGELVKLHHAMAESLGTERGTIVQFLAPEPDAAIEAVVYDLAYISAAWLGRRVLYVDGTAMRLDGKGAADGAPRREPALAGTAELGEMENTITRVVGLDLYQMAFPSMRGALDLTPALRRMPDFLARLRESFDLVLIAAPAASEAPMGMLLSRFVDGNVLVLEAGHTRAPVAAELRDALRASGGTVVGAVLTRYRSFVPRFLRRWL
jgi:protein-tyrosine kinase